MSHKGMYVPKGWSLKRKKKRCVAYFQTLIARIRERKILLVRYKKVKHNKKSYTLWSKLDHLCL